MSHRHWNKHLKRIIEHRIFAGAVIVLINFLFFHLIVSNQFFYSWNYNLTDALYTTENKTSGDILIVGIDDKSLETKEQGGLGRWQEWGRDHYTTVIQHLQAAGARVIALDVLFIDPSQNVAADQSLAKVITASDNVLLASKFDFDRNVYWKPLSFFYGGEETKIAPINIPIDGDNTARKMFLYTPFAEKIYESFDVAIVKKYLGEPLGNLNIAPVEDGQYTVTNNKIRLPFDLSRSVSAIRVPLASEGNLMYINYFGAPFSFPRVSFVDIYNNNFDPALVKNKIILIGENGATGLHDVQYTPVSHGIEMPGVEIHANTIQTLLTQKFLRTQDLKKQILSIGILNIFTTALFLMAPVFLSTIVLLLGTFAFIVFSVIAFNNGILVNMFYIPLSYVTVYVMAIMYKYFAETRAKKYIKSAFSHYVSEHLVEKIVQDPDILQLGGSKKELTILFSDLQGFTSLSEKMSPEELIAMLNDYLADMTHIVFHHRGTLDKYIGDAVMAFWGAPLEDPEHAYHACLTAVEMQHRMKEIHAQVKREKGLELYVRIGINTGEVIVGNVGSDVRFDYTVIGDNVNLASRLEGVNKQYHTFAMVSESTYHLTHEQFEFRELDFIKVKGKTKPVKIYELLAKKGHLDLQQQTVVHRFHQALLHYRSRHWDKAIAEFQEVLAIDPQDGPSSVYIERCEYYAKNPPPEDWDGSFEMKTK